MGAAHAAGIGARPEAALVAGRLALAASVLATLWLVDPAAEAAFDAPKRLAALVGLAVAAVTVASVPRPFGDGGRSRSASTVLALAALVLACLVLSALASPRSTVALDTLRRMAVIGLALPIGASRLLDGAGVRWIAGAFVAGAAGDAVVALAERLGGLSPFTVEAVTGRGATGGLVGNEGQLALVLALAAVVVLALLIGGHGSAARRIGLGMLGAVLVAGIAASANVTAVLGLGAGGFAVLALRLGRGGRRALAAATAAAILLLAVAMPLTGRGSAMLRDVRAGHWDDVTSNRLGPWAAALEMGRARPLVGFGPGTFGAEFVPHRLAAEIRWRERLVTPVLTSSYGEAHSEPLQALAEWGLPAALAAIAAAGLLLVRLFASGVEVVDPERLVLAGVLATAAVAALTWFPVQQATTSVPVLLALGRAWRRFA